MKYKLYLNEDVNNDELKQDIKDAISRGDYGSAYSLASSAKGSENYYIYCEVLKFESVKLSSTENSTDIKKSVKGSEKVYQDVYIKKLESDSLDNELSEFKIKDGDNEIKFTVTENVNEASHWTKEQANVILNKIKQINSKITKRPLINKESKIYLKSTNDTGTSSKGYQDLVIKSFLTNNKLQDIKCKKTFLNICRAIGFGDGNPFIKFLINYSQTNGNEAIDNVGLYNLYQQYANSLLSTNIIKGTVQGKDLLVTKLINTPSLYTNKLDNLTYIIKVSKFITDKKYSIDFKSTMNNMNKLNEIGVSGDVTTDVNNVKIFSYIIYDNENKVDSFENIHNKVSSLNSKETQIEKETDMDLRNADLVDEEVFNQLLTRLSGTKNFTQEQKNKLRDILNNSILVAAD